MLISEDSAKDSCVWCEQLHGLLCPVAELKEEVERLRSIRESETEINWKSYIRPTLREAQQEPEEPCPPWDQAEGGDRGDSGEWKWISAGEGIKFHPDLHHLPRYHDRTGMRLCLQRVRQMTPKKKFCLESLPVALGLSDSLQPPVLRRKEG